MSVCPDCGTENDADARFCDTCGRSLAGEGHADDRDAEQAGERVIWRGGPSKLASPRLGLTTRYRLTTERLVIEHGLLGRRTEEIDLYRVDDVAVKQNPAERLSGVGDIRLETTDATAPEITLHNVRDPERIKDLVRAAARAERERRRVLLRDEL